MSDDRPVVAELGRPETPWETADRKARDRALRRSRQTIRNLVSSLVVTVALVVVIVLAVPRGGTTAPAAVDYTAAARGASGTGTALIAPRVPAGWAANAAEIRGSGPTARWYIGFVTAKQGFAAVSEGLAGDSGWLDAELDAARPTGTASIGGLTWRVFDRRSLGDDAGNVAYGLSTKVGRVVLAVYGTPDAADVRALAAAVAADLPARGIEGTNSLP